MSNIYIQATDEDNRRAFDLLARAYSLFMYGTVTAEERYAWSAEYERFQADMLDRNLRDELNDIGASTDPEVADAMGRVVVLLERRGVLKSAKPGSGS